jgi:hypothetical protein
MFFPLSKLYLKRAIENEGSRPQLVQEGRRQEAGGSKAEGILLVQ